MDRSTTPAGSQRRRPVRRGRAALLLGAGALLAVGLGAAGCVRHIHHHHYHDDASLEREHADKTVIILHERPGPRRVCWRHRDHWHCRR